MGLDFQVAPIAFTKGLDKRSAPKLVLPGKWRTLINYSLSLNGSLQRRNGISTLIASANGNGLALRGSQLITISGGYVKSISNASTPATANAVSGRYGYVGISKAEVRRTTGMQDTPDCATGGGYTLYCWREKSPANVTVSVNCTLVDEATGTRIIDNFAMRTNAAVFGVRCVYVSAVFFIFYIQGTSLYCRTIRTAALSSSPDAEVALITSASLAALSFDCCSFGTGSSAMVSYAWADGVTSVRTIRVDQAAGVPSIGAGPTNLITEVQLPVATLTGLACAAYSNGTNAATFATSTGAASHAGLAGTVIGTTWAVSTAATQIDNAVAATTTPVHVTACIKDDGATLGLAVCWDRQSEWGTNALNPLRATVVGTTLATTLLVPSTLINSATFAAAAGTAAGPHGPFIAGKLFNSSGSIFLPVFVGSVYNSLSPSTANPRNANTQNSFFVLELLLDSSLPAQWNMVAKALYGSYGLASINGNPPSVGTPCSVPEVTSGNFAIAATELTLLVLASGTNVSPTGLVRLTMSPNFTRAPIRGELGESTYLAGGSLTAFDGAAITEQGFPLFPEGAGIVVNGAGTGAMTAGVHQVVFIYEWVDNAGQRHQSAPSLPISVTTVATGSLTCQVPTLLLSQKGGGPSIATNVQVVAFMTEADGLTFKRVLLNNGAYAPVMNSLAATLVTLTIDDADATIAGNEVLYTQPNIAPTTLANIAPGPCTALAVIQNRLFFDKADKPFWFGYSQQYVNNVGLQFSADLEGAVPSDSGGITGFADLDEKVIIFCRKRPYVMYGQGPQASGAFNSYSLPVAVQSDVGCIEPRSIVAVPGGVMFQAEKGVYLLGRDLSTSFVGAGVQDLIATPGQAPARIEAATLMPDRSEVRFVYNQDSGPMLVLLYSFLSEAWSLTAGAQTYSPADALWWKEARQSGVLNRGAFVHLSPALGLNFDDTTAIADSPGGLAAAAFYTQAQTAWLKLSALEGFQRVRWLYVTCSNSSGVAPTAVFNVQVNYNDLDSGPDTYVASATAALTAAGTAEVADFRSKLRRQKCKSVAFIFTEVPVAAADQPVTGIEAMALEVGLKKGVNRLPAAQSVG